MANTTLSIYVHEYWSNCIRYILEASKQELDGSINIPVDVVTNLKKVINTSYENLPKYTKSKVDKDAEEFLRIFIGDDCDDDLEPR